MLEKTYDACESIVGKKVNEDPILLPISHSTANAQLEVTIDMDGNFMPALSGIIPNYDYSCDGFFQKWQAKFATCTR